MAKAKTRSSSGQRKLSPAAKRSVPRQDAIALLKADHREVEGWFSQFEKARSEDRKSDLAHKICQALKVHMRIEEELFYPPFYDKTGDKELHHEAEIEHDGAKKLIAEIEASGPDDDYYDAKVKVLSEMIKHHVKEEEQAGGMFAEARRSEMDLKEIGERMRARKNQLKNGAAYQQLRGGESSATEEHVDRM
jgi:hemerythrin superfamily protein